MHYHSPELIQDISEKAQLCRLQVLKIIYHAQSGHIGGAFSVAEILTSLFFHHLRLDPPAPKPQPARLILTLHQRLRHAG